MYKSVAYLNFLLHFTSIFGSSGRPACSECACSRVFLLETDSRLALDSSLLSKVPKPRLIFEIVKKVVKIEVSSYDR